MEWIKVEDRLPDNDSTVVIFHRSGYFMPIVAKYRSDHANQFILAYRSDMNISDISHWMPLPEPPKIF